MATKKEKAHVEVKEIPVAKSQPPSVELNREYHHPEYGIIALLPAPGYERVSGRAVFLRPDDLVYIMGGIGWKRADQIIAPDKVCIATSNLFVCVMRKEV